MHGAKCVVRGSGFLQCTEDPRYNDSVCYQRFCVKIGFPVIKKLDMDPLKATITYILNRSFINNTFCVFVRIASARQF